MVTMDEPPHMAVRPVPPSVPDDVRPGGPVEAAVMRSVAAAGPESEGTLAAFRSLILGYYEAWGRDLPWRRTTDPYGIVVSEVMLQQTQVERALGRWERFLDRFPGFEALAAAPLAEVLSEWLGLGYNRRAANLKRLAEAVVAEHGGELPQDPVALRRLPGLGPATAASVSVFAFGTPVAFIETNIRAVFLHVFFEDRDGVADRKIAPIAEASLLVADARRWHWALMDYGVELKRTVPNPSRRSVHHVRQPAFEGSRRQLRGRVLRVLLASPGMPLHELAEATGDDPRLAEVLVALEREGLVVGDDGEWSIDG